MSFALKTLSMHSYEKVTQPFNIEKPSAWIHLAAQALY